MNSMKLKIASFQLGAATFVAIFALMVMPFATFAETELVLDTQEVSKINLPELTTEALVLEKVTCNLSLDSNEIVSGGSVTVSWNTTGLDEIKINGEVVSGDSGKKTFDNITENTTFTLVGSNDNGGACDADVTLKCLPPVVEECKLELHKSVDKTQANPGTHLTYTISIENTGTSDCTGGGVRILDVIDENLEFVSQSITDNLSPGYGGKSVYTESDRTLLWNGHVLNPGEVGKITWTGKVITPNKCGDFDVKNQAKATAKELNNFQDWSYSNKVTTQVDYDCEVECVLEESDPYNVVAELTDNSEDTFTVEFTNNNKCDYEVGATSYEVPVDEGQLCTWENGKLDCQIRYDFEDITVPAGETKSVTVGKPSKCYQLDWYYGISVEVLDYSQFGNPLLSYVIDAITGEDRLYWAIVDASLEDCTPPVKAPSCDLFTANPVTIVTGSTALLEWETTNAERVVINNGIGEVEADGSVSVSPLINTVYEMTVFGTEDKSVTCEVPVKVSEDPVPVCTAFTATPGNLPIGGGDVVLDWEVENATSVTISPVVGAVDLTGSTSVGVTESTTFTLTAVDSNGDEVMCSAPVTVPDPVPFTCEDNVSFNASPNSVRRGDAVNLSWNVTNADTVSISGIDATAFSGSETVNPNDDITYVLTATLGSETIECPTSVTISTGGGGGGSSSPRCELDISDERISLGEEITLTWDTSRANDVTLADDEGNIVFTTDTMLSSEKDDYLDGSITLAPTRDTEYTLTAERGSRDRTCRVSVELDDDIVIIETRDQQPLVAGISLSAVPYTGFEAGPFMTIMFYALLVAWAFYIAYLVVIRKQMSAAAEVDTTSNTVATMRSAEETRPDVFVKSVTVPENTATQFAPANLPVAEPVIGYEANQVSETTVAAIEDRAHAQKALLSSDAIRHFVTTTEGSVERNEALDQVIAEAKSAYPLEDGWIVINESRMQNLCEVCKVNAEKTPETFVPTIVPKGSSSLAEAIVTGNVVAAYEMIGNRPMFALADAAADLDAVYRNRQGENKIVSELLSVESEKLSDEQVKSMISSLTSALDGTYTNEADAVKMAIMKAVKEVA